MSKVESVLFYIILGFVIGSFLLTTFVNKPYSIELEKRVRRLETSCDYGEMEVVVAPNLPCPFCTGNTIYQARYNEFSKQMEFACCLCGYNRIECDRTNVCLRPAMIEMFKQDPASFSARGARQYQKSCYIGTYTYRDDWLFDHRIDWMANPSLFPDPEAVK